MQILAGFSHAETWRFSETGLEDVAAFQILKILNRLLLVLLFQLSSPFQEYIKYLDKARGRAALQPIANWTESETGLGIAEMVKFWHILTSSLFWEVLSFSKDCIRHAHNLPVCSFIIASWVARSICLPSWSPMKKQQWRNLAATGSSGSWMFGSAWGLSLHQLMHQIFVILWLFIVFSWCITMRASSIKRHIWIHGLARAALREMSFTQGEDVLTQGEQGAMVPCRSVQMDVSHAIAVWLQATIAICCVAAVANWNAIDVFIVITTWKRFEMNTFRQTLSLKVASASESALSHQNKWTKEHQLVTFCRSSRLVRCEVMTSTSSLMARRAVG